MASQKNSLIEKLPLPWSLSQAPTPVRLGDAYPLEMGPLPGTDWGSPPKMALCLCEHSQCRRIFAFSAEVGTCDFSETALRCLDRCPWQTGWVTTQGAGTLTDSLLLTPRLCYWCHLMLLVPAPQLSGQVWMPAVSMDQYAGDTLLQWEMGLWLSCIKFSLFFFIFEGFYFILCTKR